MPSLSHSFFQTNVTQWSFDLLSHPLSSRCQVQWESLYCWMPSDTFQNNDNKLQAFLHTVHSRGFHCRHILTSMEQKPEGNCNQGIAKVKYSNNKHILSISSVAVFCNYFILWYNTCCASSLNLVCVN